MPAKRKTTLKALFAGLITAVLFTLAAMLLIAAALVWLRFSDGLIIWLNQAVKLLAILLGAIVAVSRGGRNGLATGVLIALAYMVIGYVLYTLLGGAAFSFTSFLGELLLGAAVGAVTGSVRANLNPRKRSSRA